MTLNPSHSQNSFDKGNAALVMTIDSLTSGEEASSVDSDNSSFGYFHWNGDGEIPNSASTKTINYGNCIKQKQHADLWQQFPRLQICEDDYLHHHDWKDNISAATLRGVVVCACILLFTTWSSYQLDLLGGSQKALAYYWGLVQMNNLSSIILFPEPLEQSCSWPQALLGVTLEGHLSLSPFRCVR